MKKTRRIAVVAATLALLVAVSAGSYAWFTSQSGNLMGSGSAAVIDLEGKFAGYLLECNKLPGEELENITGKNRLTFNATRDAIIRFTLEANGNLTNLTHPDWDDLDPAIKSTDYYTDGGITHFTEKRLHEILKIKTNPDKPVADLYQVPGQNIYYLFVRASDSPMDLHDLLKVVLDGEFGGVMGDGSGNLSPSRQFEQASSFPYISIYAEAVQVTETAVVDVWGTDALTQIQSMPNFAADIQSASTWGLAG